MIVSKRIVAFTVVSASLVAAISAIVAWQRSAARSPIEPPPAVQPVEQPSGRAIADHQSLQRQNLNVPESQTAVPPEPALSPAPTSAPRPTEIDHAAPTSLESEYSDGTGISPTSVPHEPARVVESATAPNLSPTTPPQGVSYGAPPVAAPMITPTSVPTQVVVGVSGSETDASPTSQPEH